MYLRLFFLPLSLAMQCTMSVFSQYGKPGRRTVVGALEWVCLVGREGLLAVPVMKE